MCTSSLFNGCIKFGKAKNFPLLYDLLRMNGFCPLASGSKGNAIFVGTRTTRVLIDAGIRAKTVEERLASIGVALESLQAILITHEHTDHIAGLEVLSQKLNIPILVNGTRNCRRTGKTAPI